MNNPEKSTWPSSRPTGGMITSSTTDATIFPKAAPMMTPTAISMTLPRMANSLNSFSTDFLLYFFDEGQRRPRAETRFREGLSWRRIISEAKQKSGTEWGDGDGGGYRSARPKNQNRPDDAAHREHNPSRF